MSLLEAWATDADPWYWHCVECDARWDWRNSMYCQARISLDSKERCGRIMERVGDFKFLKQPDRIGLRAIWDIRLPPLFHNPRFDPTFFGCIAFKETHP